MEKTIGLKLKKLSKYKAAKSPVPMIQQGNTVLDSDLDKANAFAEYYENLWITVRMTGTNKLQLSTNGLMIFSQASYAELIYKSRTMNTNRS